jgi:flagellar basal-body rod protein FlgC
MASHIGMFGNTSLFRAMQTASSGMRVQSQRLMVVAQNLAGAEITASKPGGTPYRRQMIAFKSIVDRASGVRRVGVKRVMPDRSDFKEVHDPSHPAADANGMVKYPNVDRHVEMRDLHEAQRAHLANLNMVKILRDMMHRTIRIIG